MKTIHFILNGRKRIYLVFNLLQNVKKTRNFLVSPVRQYDFYHNIKLDDLLKILEFDESETDEMLVFSSYRMALMCKGQASTEWI